MPSVECIHRSSLRSPHVFVALFRYVWRTGGKGALFRNASGRFLRGWFLQYSMGIRYEASQKNIPKCNTFVSHWGFESSKDGLEICASNVFCAAHVIFDAWWTQSWGTAS